MQVEATFKGRVQGVGFRATAQMIARKLRLCGSVRNLNDGSVKLIAHGLKIDLEQLFKELKELFPGVVVEKISYKRNATPAGSGFSILS